MTYGIVVSFLIVCFWNLVSLRSHFPYFFRTLRRTNRKNTVASSYSTRCWYKVTRAPYRWFVLYHLKNLGYYEGVVQCYVKWCVGETILNLIDLGVNNKNDHLPKFNGAIYLINTLSVLCSNLCLYQYNKL